MFGILWLLKFEHCRIFFHRDRYRWQAQLCQTGPNLPEYDHGVIQPLCRECMQNSAKMWVIRYDQTRVQYQVLYRMTHRLQSARLCVAVSSLLNANVFTSQVYICWLPTESKYLFRFDLAVELLTFTGLRNHFVLNRFLMLFESQWFSMLTHSRFRNGFFGACTFVRSKGQTGRQTDRDRELQLWVRAIFINPAIWRNLSRSVFLSLSILYLFARIPFRSAFNIF